MISRRALILTGLFASTFAHRALAASSSADPVAIVTKIYIRVANGKGDRGGTFVIDTKAAKAKYLSKSLVVLWTKADARTQKGDGGPIGFDPITNSQDPDVKSFTVTAEKLEADKAVIAATIVGDGPRTTPADQVVRYDFVREGTAWKIDDIRGAVDGESWSIRALLLDSFKY